MFGAQLAPDSPNGRLLARLGPKMVANHLVKRSEYNGYRRSDIAHALGQASRLDTAIIDFCRETHTESLLDAIAFETKCMMLAGSGQEGEIGDAERCAAFAWSDVNQRQDRRSIYDLEFYSREGLLIRVDDSARETASRVAKHDTRDVPLIEKLKSQRILSVNGFEGSRVMHALHDVVDHIWLFELLERNGLLARYADFLGSIDLASESFLYSRQAEVLATVGFGLRSWPSAMAANEVLVLELADISAVLGTSQDYRVVDARRLLDAMTSRTLLAVTFVIENMLLQMCDERRRWGAVKQQLTSGALHQAMNLLDPVYIALLIEAVDAVRSTASFVTAQAGAALSIEQVLVDIVDTKTDAREWRVPLPRRSVEDSPRSHGPKARWIADNLNLLTRYGPG